MLRACAALLAALAVVACGRGATIRVPGDAPTIQAAIDQASDGDTVLVAPGVYLETIDLLGKQITLRGEQGAAQTIIDGHGSGPVVRISTGPGTQPVIEGFTITGGRPQQIGLSGAGILSLAMSPVIRDCIIEDNVADGIGGGVADLPYVRGASAPAAELVVMLGQGPETLSEALTFDLGQQPVDLAVSGGMTGARLRAAS